MGVKGVKIIKCGKFFNLMKKYGTGWRSIAAEAERIGYSKQHVIDMINVGKYKAVALYGFTLILKEDNNDEGQRKQRKHRKVSTNNTKTS